MSLRENPAPVVDVIASLVLGSFLMAGVVIPLGAVFSQLSFSSSFTPELVAAMKQTGFQATLSAALATALGLITALILRYLAGVPLDRVTQTLLALPFGIPAVTAATAWSLLLPKTLNFSLKAVIIAHVFFNIPWAALWIGRALTELPLRQIEAARTLGANSFQRLRWIALPFLAPSVAGVFAQIFSFCAMSFVLVMILGGGPPVETLETVLFSKIRNNGLDLRHASICAVAQLLITLLPWLMVRLFFPGDLLASRSQSVRVSGPARKSALRRVANWCVATIFIVPYFSLGNELQWGSLWTSCLQDSASRQEVIAGLKSSFELGLLSSLAGVGMALLGVWWVNRFSRWSGLVRAILVLPAGVSAMVLGLGFFLAWGWLIDPFSAAVLPVILVQGALLMPIAFRVMEPIARLRDRSTWEAARVLGATPWQAFLFLEVRRWLAPVFSVFMLLLGAALGEVGVVSLFYHESRVPLALLISRWMGRYHFEDAKLLSLGLLITSAVLMSLGFSGVSSLEKSSEEGILGHVTR